MKVNLFNRYLVPILILGAAACGPRIDPPARTAAELGEKLFFDPILSRDSSISCASCHKPEFAFADNVPLSPGVFHRTGNRNTPTVMNLVDRNAYFWDGRSSTLAEQALGPMENMVEMDFPLSLSVRRLARQPWYRASFRSVFGSRPTRELLGDAIAAYEETLVTSDTPFDDYMRGRDTTGMSAAAVRGMTVFNGKGRCFDCHFGPDFSGNDDFRNIGLFNGRNLNDSGRFMVTRDPRDIGAFKVPGLRNIAQTAPYMHNGMMKTLDAVIDFYDDPRAVVPDAVNLDTAMHRPLGLSASEKNDLKAFLLSLSDRQFTHRGAAKP